MTTASRLHKLDFGCRHDFIIVYDLQFEVRLQTRREKKTASPNRVIALYFNYLLSITSRNYHCVFLMNIVPLLTYWTLTAKQLFKALLSYSRIKLNFHNNVLCSGYSFCLAVLTEVKLYKIAAEKITRSKRQQLN